MNLSDFYSYRQTDRFFEVSGVQLPQPDRGFFHYRRVVFSSMIKSRVGNILVKATALRVTLNLDGILSHLSHILT